MVNQYNAKEEEKRQKNDVTIGTKWLRQHGTATKEGMLTKHSRKLRYKYTYL